MSPKESPQMQSGMASQQYCLKWNNHQLNLLRSFDRLLQSESFTDVTLACEGRSLRAHKVVLSACSNYFETLFEEHPDKSPILILKDMKFEHVSQLVNFMYRGEINITQDMLSGLLRTAETLKVKGLAEVSGDQSGNSAAAAAAAAVAAAQQFTPIPQTFRIGGPISHLVPSPGSALSSAMSIPTATPRLAPLAALLNPEMLLDEQRVNLLKRINMDEEQLEPIPKFPRKEIKKECQSGINTIENNVTPVQSRVVDPPQVSKPGGAKQNCQQGSSPKQKKQEPPQSPPQQILTPIPPEITVNAHIDLPNFLKEFQVFRLNDYLGFRTRQQFWEEPAVRRIMEGIKNKEIDMKSAAELLGVSYGTLYGRYREVFGYLKHAWVNKPNRSQSTPVKEEKPMWLEGKNQDVIKQVLNKELSLTAAAVRLGVDYNTFFAHLTDNGKNQERVKLLTNSGTSVDRTNLTNDEDMFSREEEDFSREDEAFSGDEEHFLADMEKTGDELHDGTINNATDDVTEYENDLEMNGDHNELEDEEMEDDITPEEDEMLQEHNDVVDPTTTLEQTMVDVDTMEKVNPI